MELSDILDVLASLEEAGVEYAVYDDPSIDEVTAADLAGAYPAIQYGPPGAGPGRRRPVAPPVRSG